jgi:dipeptidyl aminopeptidase/acylaminoacyl peptidase
MRDAHSFVGVYDADANSLVFLDPSTDHDEEPIWSPDGSRIAFIREPSAPGERTSGAVRAAQPWSIRVADARTGVGREVWRAAPGAGSAFWGFMNNERQLFWGRDRSGEDRIAFAWERTGWVHLYSVSTTGSAPAVDLTPGQHEVEHVAITPNGEALIYSSNQDDIDRRHLWRVNIGSAGPQRITSGMGIEYWPVVSADGGAIAFQATGARVPPHIEVLRLGASAPQRQVLAPDIAPKEFPAGALVEPQQVIFPSTDSLEIHGQLFLPAGYRAGVRYPAVLYFHGGSRAQMVLGYHYHRFDYYQKHYGLNQYLANHGYIVLSVNYRSGTGYGMKFREAEHYGASGASEVQDVIAAGQYLRRRADVDSKRIGLWGGSYGGYLTGMGLARASDLFAAGFDLHGVESWDARLQFSPFSPLTAAEREEVRLVARRSSPLGNVDTWRSPVLFVHGDDDRNVMFNQTVALVSELRKRGVDVEELVIPNEIHSFLRHASWVRALGAGADFLDRRLKNNGANGAVGLKN